MLFLSRSFALVGRSRAFRAAAPLSHEHGQEEPGQEADAARCCRRGHACAEERTGKAAGGRPPGIETAARTATATPSTANKHVRETHWGATGGQDPVSVCVADLRKWGCGVSSVALETQLVTLINHTTVIYVVCSLQCYNGRRLSVIDGVLKSR